MLTEDIKNFIKEKSIFHADIQREACGIIVDSKPYLIPNIHFDAANNFKFHPDSLMKFSQESIEAIWHSHWKDEHPGEFTFTDLEMARSLNKPFILYHAGFDVWDYYIPSHYNPFPLKESKHYPSEIEYYLEWRSVWGRSDCFALIRCYFLGMYGIDIGDFKRPAIVNNQFPPTGWISPWRFEDHGFIELPKNTQPQTGDLFGIADKGGKEYSHASVMVDAEKNLILHTIGLMGKSQTSIYGRYWRDRTVVHVRHKDFI